MLTGDRLRSLREEQGALSRRRRGGQQQTTRARFLRMHPLEDNRHIRSQMLMARVQEAEMREQHAQVASGQMPGSS